MYQFSVHWRQTVLQHLHTAEAVSADGVIPDLFPAKFTHQRAWTDEEKQTISTDIFTLAAASRLAIW